MAPRLLIEYPEPQRREVLDYLFKPHFGAGFQHLKVEIGGEVNSTDGIELTHQRSRTDRNYDRGYEWWLMQEAKRRNGELSLDSLAWGASGWLGGGKFYSQATADYLTDFLVGARRVHHLDIAYTGIWNETAHNAEWIKLLRRTLDHAGLQHVGIVAADDYDQGGWKIVEDMKKDPELRAAVARVGVHYRDSQSPPAAQSVGCPLWSSEDGPWRGDWEGAMRIARTLNRNYIVGRFTKTEIWSPVTAYYDTLPLPGSGVMRANEPWSGHYDVQPAVWAVAHTTQFAGPGWRYLDSACRRFEGGSSVALQSPSGRDLSVIIETMDAKAAQRLELSATGLPGKTLHVWRTTRESQFERLADLRAVAGKYSLPVLPAAIYSLTTTTGQRKGTRNPPPSQTLSLPYIEDFSSYQVGASPRLFADQAGVFEVRQREDGQGNCLRQVLTAKGIEWPGHKDPAPESVMGDARWTDCTISADARLEPGSYASLLGRVSVVPNNTNLPACYDFKVGANGKWELRAIVTVRGNLPWFFIPRVKPARRSRPGGPIFRHTNGVTSNSAWPATGLPFCSLATFWRRFMTAHTKVDRLAWVATGAGRSLPIFQFNRPSTGKTSDLPAQLNAAQDAGSISMALISGFSTLLVNLMSSLPLVTSTLTVSTYALSGPPAFTYTSKSLNSWPPTLKENTRWPGPSMPS